MDNQTLQKIKDSLGKSDSIAIAVGKNPTIDDMAAALSLYLTLEQAQKKVTVVSATEPLVELSSLVGIDKVKVRLETEGTGDLIVSFPYREGEIEKVSYTIENNLLNIVVKAGESGLSFDERDIRYNRGGSSSVQLLIVVGTPALSDLASLFPSDVLKDTTIINIDNKQDNQGYGDIVLVSPRFSSVSEQVADLLLSLGLDFDIDIAQNLMNGIAFATHNFHDQKSSYLAFEIAGILMRKGAIRPQEVRENITPAPAFVRENPREERRQTQMGTPIQPQQKQQAQQPFFEPQFEEPQDQKKAEDQPKPPADWLTPKVYKGSSSIS